MTDTWERLAADEMVTPERVVCADSLSRALLAVASRTVHGRDCADLGHLPLAARFRGVPGSARRAAVVRAAQRAAVPAGAVGRIDAEALAAWVIGHYPQPTYPAVVIGSPHGAAVHLAVAMGAAWLPAGLPVSVRWLAGAVDDPAAALSVGAPLVSRLLAANPGVSVRQVHDPFARGVLAGATLELHLRWRALPVAYRRFLTGRLRPDAPVLLVRDARTWPVLDVGGGHTFQVGAPASGAPADYLPGAARVDQILRALGADATAWRPPTTGCPAGYAQHGVEAGFEESLRRHLRGIGNPLHRVLFPGADTLSAAVADLLRRWLRENGKHGNRCVVECGRLLDPSQTERSGLVPYWVESADRGAVAGAEWWLAGSERFASVDVLPQAPGLADTDAAGLTQWRAVASFGRLRGQVDRAAARAYPLYPLPTRHATESLSAHPYDLPRPMPLRLPAVLDSLRDSGSPSGLLIC